MKETTKNQQIENIVENYKDILNKLDSYKELKDLLNYMLDGNKLISLTKDEIKDLNDKIKKNIENIEKIEKLLKNKSHYFEVPISKLLHFITKTLTQNKLDSKIRQIYNTVSCEEFYNSYDQKLYRKEFEFGVQVDGKQITFIVQKTVEDYLYGAGDAILKDIKINLLKTGLINNKEDFASQEYQDYFWGIFKSNIEKDIKKLTEKRNAKIQSLEKKYEEMINDILL